MAIIAALPKIGEAISMDRLQRGLRVCCWPIVLQKSVCTDDQNSAGCGRGFRVKM
jgi:hypothetical protein